MPNHLRSWASGLLLTLLILAPLPLVATSFQGRYKEQMISQSFGVVALMGMALALVLAGRPFGINALFGGLDKAYVVHKWLGLAALAAMTLHDSLEAEIKGQPDAFGLHDLASEMGGWAYNAILVLIAATFIHLIPYRWWRMSHRVMLAMFALGLVHFLLVAKPLALTDPASVYVTGWCLAGLLSGLWLLRPQALRAPARYTVDQLDKSGSTVSMTLKPQGKPIRHKAGQFVFVSGADQGPVDQHPFTIGAAPRADGSLRISFAVRSGWTRTAAETLSIGDALNVSKPHGRFVQKHSKNRQVWLSAGIGVTPFLAWAETDTQPKGAVEIIHICRDRALAPDLSALETYAAAHPDQVRLKVIETATSGRPDARMLAGLLRDLPGHTDVYYCGPDALRETLEQVLKSATRGTARIHDEAFQLRTGLWVPNWLERSLKTQWDGFAATNLGKTVSGILQRVSRL